MQTIHDLTAHLPSQAEEAALFPRIQQMLRDSKQRLVVIDDDPTGTQTVHDVELLLNWDEHLLSEALQHEQRLFYLLTNSRSMPEQEATTLNEFTARQLMLASRTAQADFVIASRSDSTLRGHYPAEIHALERGLGQPWDGHLVVPAFFEGGRYTINDTHYVATPTADADTLQPAHETPYARDSAFGYTTAYLPAWIEEKSKGYWRADQVISLDLSLIRNGGPEAVAAKLKAVTGGLPVVVNAAGYGDLATVVLGLLQAEASTKRFAYRTAASFVRLRGGVALRPLLSTQEIIGQQPKAQEASGGLVVVGSYVPASTKQLEALLTLPTVTGIELPVERIVQSEDEAHIVSASIGQHIDELLRQGRTSVVFTSRALVSGANGAEFLAIGRRISQALIAVIREITTPPRFIIAKGGITSHDVAQHGMGARRARVLGQLFPGVPVWRLESVTQSRFADIPYIVFPGNVGSPDSLKEAVQALTRA
jgi:uncharacterized protein YgbK (DUF1537 family)